MEYTIKITTEDIQSYRTKGFPVILNIPAGKYKLTGTGSYFLGSGGTFAYYWGQTQYWVITLGIVIDDVPTWVSQLFDSNHEAIVEVKDGGSFGVIANDPWGRYADGYANDLRYTLTPIEACQDMLTGINTVTPLGLLKIVSVNPVWPGSVLVNLAGTEYTIKDGLKTQVPGGELSVSNITIFGARVCLRPLEVPPEVPPTTPPEVPPTTPPEVPPTTPPEVPPTTPPTTPPGSNIPPGETLPPSPVLDACVLPELSWNFVEVVRQAVSYISCNLQNLILQVNWMISALAALIPQLLAGIAYFLSLKWITDWIQAFFTQLDIWFSLKFGIDPALPFWDELVKKTLTWISGALDAAAEERIKIRKW